MDLHVLRVRRHRGYLDTGSLSYTLLEEILEPLISQTIPLGDDWSRMSQWISNPPDESDRFSNGCLESART